MTKVFSYDYKEDLVKKLQKRYQKELLEYEIHHHEQEELDEAEKIIREYFQEVKKEMRHLIEAAAGDIMFEWSDAFIVCLTIHQNYIKITRTPKSIEIKVGKFNVAEGMVVSEVMAYIVPNDKKCVLKMVGKVHEGGHFDANSLNCYMREAFGHID